MRVAHIKSHCGSSAPSFGRHTAWPALHAELCLFSYCVFIWSLPQIPNDAALLTRITVHTRVVPMTKVSLCDARACSPFPVAGTILARRCEETLAEDAEEIRIGIPYAVGEHWCTTSFSDTTCCDASCSSFSCTYKWGCDLSYCGSSSGSCTSLSSISNGLSGGVFLSCRQSRHPHRHPHNHLQPCSLLPSLCPSYSSLPSSAVSSAAFAVVVNNPKPLHFSNT